MPVSNAVTNQFEAELHEGDHLCSVGDYVV
jgi:hypothetical protein